MTFGARIYNSSGEVLLDDEYPAMVLDASGTSTGSLYDSSSPWLSSDGSATSAQYLHDYSAAEEIRFYQIPVGSWLAFSVSHGKYVSDQQNLTFRNASVNYTASGYGLALRDASGSLVYSANESLVPLKDAYDLDNSGSLGGGFTYTGVNESLEYVKITTERQVVRMYGQPPTLLGPLLISGAYRKSASRWESMLAQIGGTFGVKNTTGTVGIKAILA